PNVLRVDAASGTITAVSEGTAVIVALAGTARTDITVSVLPATVAASAPVSRPPAAQPAESPSRPAAPTAEENRAKAETALREAATNMIEALKSKNVARATQL